MLFPAPVVKSRSTFNDPTAEINRITLSLKSDITSLNEHLESIQVCGDVVFAVVAATRNSSYRQSFVDADLKTQPRGHQQSSVHSMSVVNSLKSKLALATKSFQQVLKVGILNFQPSWFVIACL